MDIVIPEVQNPAGSSRGTVVEESSHCQWSAPGILGPVLFLIFINDLPEDINSRTRLFADDCILYRQISFENDQKLLQEDLDRLVTWRRPGEWSSIHRSVASCVSLGQEPLEPSSTISKVYFYQKNSHQNTWGGSTVQPIVEKSHKPDN